MPAGAQVIFTISIPLKLDYTVEPGHTQTNYQLHAADLNSCASHTSDNGSSYTDASLGIPNTVTLTGEDLTYSQIAIPDNTACVPLALPKQPIHLEKYGTDCDAGVPSCPLSGAAFALYSTDPSVAGATPMTDGITANPGNPAAFTSVPLDIDHDY